MKAQIKITGQPNGNNVLFNALKNSVDQSSEGAGNITVLHYNRVTDARNDLRKAQDIIILNENFSEKEDIDQLINLGNDVLYYDASEARIYTKNKEAIKKATE